MNGASKIPPIKLKIFDDTQEGCPTKYIAALNAKTEVIDPAIVRNKIEHVKSVTKKAINDYYRNFSKIYNTIYLKAVSILPHFCFLLKN